MPRQIALRANLDGTIITVNVPVPPQLAYYDGPIDAVFTGQETYETLPGDSISVEGCHEIVRHWWVLGKKIEAIKHLQAYTLYYTGAKWPLKACKDYAEKVAQAFHLKA